VTPDNLRLPCSASEC